MKRLFNMKEVEEFLGISYVTIYKLVKEGHLKAYKIGGSTRFKQEDLEALVESGSVLGTYMSARKRA